MKRVMVLAPHPDDETLGCGATLLRLRRGGAAVHWAVLTRMTRAGGFTAARIRRRHLELSRVARHYRFEGTHLLGFPTKRLDTVPREDLVSALSRLLAEVKPDTLFVPHGGDAHSDHRVGFETAISCVKSFRCPGIKRVLAYETLSETEFSQTGHVFSPNSFCDVTDFMEGKLAAFRLYAGEGGSHPFPRSEERIRALALLRGGTAAVPMAEAFCLLKEIW